jgi:hypothetical protein
LSPQAAHPEEGELADAIERLGAPAALTLEQVACHSDAEFGGWLRDRRNSRLIPFRMEACGYVVVQNPGSAVDGRWRMGNKRQNIYAKSHLSPHDRTAAARALAEEART